MLGERFARLVGKRAAQSARASLCFILDGLKLWIIKVVLKEKKGIMEMVRKLLAAFSIFCMYKWKLLPSSEAG